MRRKGKFRKRKTRFWKLVDNYVRQGHPKGKAIRLAQNSLYGRKRVKRPGPKRETHRVMKESLPEQPKPSHGIKIKKAYIIIAALFIILIIIFPQHIVEIIGLFILSAIFIYVMGWIMACPNCHKFHARVTVDSSEIDTYTKFVPRTKTIVHRDAMGREMGTSTVTERVPVTMRRFQEHYQCRFCGHTWSSGTKEERA